MMFAADTPDRGGLSRPFIFSLVLLIVFMSMHTDWNSNMQRRRMAMAGTKVNQDQHRETIKEKVPIICVYLSLSLGFSAHCFLCCWPLRILTSTLLPIGEVVISCSYLSMQCKLYFTHTCLQVSKTTRKLPYLTPVVPTCLLTDNYGPQCLK